MADSSSRVRWDSLRGTLAKRYANAAEAYVAMGGRAGGELSLQQLERSLQDLNGRVLGLRRGAAPVQTVDVHGILADVEKSFQSGMNYQQFAAALKWEEKQPEVLRSKDMTSRVMVGAPGASLRPKPVLTALRGSNAQPLNQNSPDAYRDPRSFQFADWKGKKWTGSRAPSANFMQQQRRKTAVHAAASMDKHAKLLKDPNLGKTLDAIQAAEQKLQRLMQIQDSEQANPQTPFEPLIQKPKEVSKMLPALARHQSASPAAPQERLQSPPRKAEASPSPQPPVEGGVGGSGITMSSKAAELSGRLAALNSTVFEQKLSLAETEKNILRKERQELQAQLRQMNQLQRQAQVDMQSKMTDQFGKAMKETFEQIKDVMKSIQGPDKKDLASLNEAFEQKIREELLPLVTEGENIAAAPDPVTLEKKRSELYGPLNTDRHNFFDSVMSVQSETEGERVGNGFFFQMLQDIEKARPEMKQSSDHVDAGNLHSTKSPFLLAILNTLQYNPVLTWYTVDTHYFPNAGSVGKLARLDPLNGQDYVDDFLLEMLIAIRLNQIFTPGVDRQSGQSVLGTIMPIFFGGEHPQRFAGKYFPFPREKLYLLSNKPSIETAKLACKLLHSIGVTTPEHYLRMSIREVVGKIMDFPGVWMDRFDSKAEAQTEAAKIIAGLSRAEKAALVAKRAEAGADTERFARLMSEDQIAHEDENSGNEEDELSQQQRDTRRQQKKWQEEEHNKRDLQRKLEESEHNLEVEKKKSDCLALFERCFRDLGFDSQSKNLASLALKNRGIVVRDAAVLQEGRNGEADAATKRKLEKAMRRFMRIEGLLKKQSFQKWFNWSSTIRNFKERLAWRSNSKRTYFDLWASWLHRSQMSEAMCEKLYSKKKAHLLQIFWGAWRELREEETERMDDKVADVVDPAHLSDLLRKLEAAVVETHEKHSDLLAMTRDEEIMTSLLQKLSPDACDALRNAGITKLKHLLEITMDKDQKGQFDDSELRGYGVSDPLDLKRLKMFLVNQDIGDVAQVPGDFDQKREKLSDDMNRLREKLDVKKLKLMEEFPNENSTPDGGKDEPQKDPNIRVLHDLLEALDVPRDDWKKPEDNDMLKKEADETSADGDEEFAGQHDQTKKDKETRDYIAKLKSERELLNQTILQALSHSLGEVVENDADKKMQDGETDKSKMAFEEQLQSMQQMIEISVKALERARPLLDKDDPAAQEDENVDEVRKKDNASNILEKFLSQALGQPYERAEALSLGITTSAEKQAEELKADVERRSKLAHALENENMNLKQQLDSMTKLLSRQQMRRPAEFAGKKPGSPKQHWTAGISDPELAQKYRQSSSEDDESFVGEMFSAVDDDGMCTPVLEEQFLDPELVKGLMAYDDQPTSFGYSLFAVDGQTPCTRSSIFDTLLDDMIKRGQAALDEHINLTKQELDEVSTQISSAENTVQECHKKQEVLQKHGAKSHRPVNAKQGQEEILANDNEFRRAENTLKELTQRRSALEASLNHLNSQREALDLRKEFERMDQKMSDEVTQATVELNGLLEAVELDQTPEITDRISEARDKVSRIEASWKLKRNMRIKEIEIEIMNQKMAEDQKKLQFDAEKSKDLFVHNANDARGELATVLKTMQDSVTNTARGRCRPEVLASMPAVQKMHGAIRRLKATNESQHLAERSELLAREQTERQKKEDEERKKSEDEELKRIRATDSLQPREEQLSKVAQAFKEKKAAMLKEAKNCLEDAKRALANDKSDFCRMHVTKIDGKRRHAKSFLQDARAIYSELDGAMDDGPERQEFESCQNEVDTLNAEVDEASKELFKAVSAARERIEALLRKDLRKMDEALANEIADVRIRQGTLMKSLDELKDVEDGQRVKANLLAAEEKLRHCWGRLAPKLDDALYGELARGDQSLDMVLNGIANGKLSAAAKELAKAQEAYNKVNLAKSAAKQ